MSDRLRSWGIWWSLFSAMEIYESWCVIQVGTFSWSRNLFRHLSVVSDEYCKPTFALSLWGESRFKQNVFTFSSCHNVRSQNCMAEVWGTARSRAQPKTLLLLAEASSSSAPWSLNPTNSRDLNILKCLPGYFLVPLSPGGPCGFLRAQHRSQQVNKKKSSEEEMQMRIHFARSLSPSRLNYNWATPILAQSVCP